MRNKIVIITILVISLLFCSCSSDSKKDEDKEEINNPTVEEQDNLENDEYRKSKSIMLIKDFNNKEETYDGGYYQLYLNNDRCTFLYEGADFTELTCDFSKDIFEEVLEMICSQELEVYESKSDENGKIVDETIPYVLALRSSKMTYLKAPSNIDEIVAKFESLTEQAEPPKY